MAVHDFLKGTLMRVAKAGDFDKDPDCVVKFQLPQPELRGHSIYDVQGLQHTYQNVDRLLKYFAQAGNEHCLCWLIPSVIPLP